MDFYTMVLRKSASYWVGLCLENGLISQGITQEPAIKQLKEAITSFQEAYKTEPKTHCAPSTIEELHEFLAVEDRESNSEIFEIRKLYA